MLNFITILINKENIKINFDDIVYIKSFNNYVKMVTNSGTYLLLKKLKNIETALCSYQFCRIHRSHIISLKCIISYNKNRVLMKQNISLPLSKSYNGILAQKTSGKFDVKAKIDEFNKN